MCNSNEWLIDLERCESLQYALIVYLSSTISTPWYHNDKINLQIAVSGMEDTGFIGRAFHFEVESRSVKESKLLGPVSVTIACDPEYALYFMSPPSSTTAYLVSLGTPLGEPTLK